MLPSTTTLRTGPPAPHVALSPTLACPVESQNAWATRLFERFARPSLIITPIWVGSLLLTGWVGRIVFTGVAILSVVGLLVGISLLFMSRRARQAPHRAERCACDRCIDLLRVHFSLDGPETVDRATFAASVARRTGARATPGALPGLLAYSDHARFRSRSPRLSAFSWALNATTLAHRWPANTVWSPAELAGLEAAAAVAGRPCFTFPADSPLAVELYLSFTGRGLSHDEARLLVPAILAKDPAPRTVTI